MKTAFIIFSTNAIKIHKFSSSLICHTLDSERAASSMLHDFHKAHHPSDECSHFGERLHDSPEHCSCLSLGLQAPRGGSCADARPAADTRGSPGQQDAAVPAPCSPPSSHPTPHRGPRTPPVPPPPQVNCGHGAPECRTFVFSSGFPVPPQSHRFCLYKRCTQINNAQRFKLDFTLLSEFCEISVLHH